MDGNGSTGLAEAPQVVELGALQSITRAEIDTQIATAKQYPRNLSQVVARAKELAVFTLETAESCFYRLPRDGKIIEGPSIRLAEIVLCTWGNLRAGCRVIDVGERMITAQGIVHDLESNVLITREVQRRITTKKGRRYSDDMIVVTGNAACSIALRNATFNVVPRSIVKEVEQHIVHQMESGKLGDLHTLRDKMVQAFAEHDVTADEIARHVGKRSIEGITMVDIVTLRRTYTSLIHGIATADELFRGAKRQDDPGLEETNSDGRSASDRMADSLTGAANSDDNGASDTGGRQPHWFTGLKSHRGDATAIKELADAAIEKELASREELQTLLAERFDNAASLQDVEAVQYGAVREWLNTLVFGPDEDDGEEGGADE